MRYFAPPLRFFAPLSLLRFFLVHFGPGDPQAGARHARACTAHSDSHTAARARHGEQFVFLHPLHLAFVGDAPQLLERRVGWTGRRLSLPCGLFDGDLAEMLVFALCHAPCPVEDEHHQRGEDQSEQQRWHRRRRRRRWWRWQPCGRCQPSGVRQARGRLCLGQPGLGDLYLCG